MIELPKLPYELNYLEPVMSKQQLDIHYNKHHATYVKNLNKLIEDTEYEGKSLDQIIKQSKSGNIFNNAAQIWNHTFFWNSLTSKDKSKFNEKSELGKAILEQYETVDEFKKQFINKGKQLFGSGWVWLLNDDKLTIKTTKDGDNFVHDSDVHPLLVCDLWEHSYYLQYKNDRVTYLENILTIINWELAEQNYQGKK